jgi:hypothetical protein
MDGRPFDMWGIRVANALENDRTAHDLLLQLESYLEFGVNTLSIFLQGGSTGQANPFDADGSFTRNTRRGECSDLFKQCGDAEGIAHRNSHLDRLHVIIEQADKLGMAVGIGVFYQARIRQFAGEDAIRAATRSVANWIQAKGYRNVFTDLVNEYGHGGFSGIGLCYGETERFALDGGEELLGLFKSICPTIPSGISANGPVPAEFPSGDLVYIHHLHNPADIRKTLKRDQPIVLNEWSHGKIGRGISAEAGMYSREDVATWRHVVDTVRGGGGCVFFHSNWKQHLNEHGGPHFEIGPPGEQPQDEYGGVPSDHWYFEMVRQLRG